jgi:preprotein translocase subunit SecE
MRIGKKGDVNRYILYAVIILILIVLIIVIFFGGMDILIENLFIKEVLS